MVHRKTAIAIRKTHRYLGLFLGLQFLIWTISGTYFSWTDIDEIHGDQFLRPQIQAASFGKLSSPSAWEGPPIKTLSLRQIGAEPYYFINGKRLIHARTGKALTELTEEQALEVASRYMASDLKATSVERIVEVGDHHEYRGGPLPAYVVHFEHPEDLKAYVSAKDGSFQRVRHRSWRWYDFLWMTHTMDYEGRDNINTVVLRAFSLMGLITVLSGFTLWIVSSPRIQKGMKRIKNNGRKDK